MFMKKILYILILAVVCFSGCKREDDPVLDDPDTRLNAKLSEYETLLSSASNGWKAEIYPKGGKGYSFYFKFEDGNVTMLSDFNGTTSVTPAKSTYRLKALQLPTLIFDTYSYVHMLSDPSASVSGGTQGQGLQSDFEFAIIKSTADSIALLGTFNGNVMMMTKLSSEEETAYLNSGFKTSVDINAQYITTNKFPYLQFEDNIQIAVAMDQASRTMTLTYTDGSVVKALSAKFAFNLTGYSLSVPIVYGSHIFSEVYWDAAVKQYYVLSGTTRTYFQTSVTPVIPFNLVFGAGKDYSQIEYNPASVATGLSADFNTRYNAARTGLAAVGNANRVLDYIRVIFPIDAPNTMVLRFYYRNAAGSSFQANMTYSFTVNASGEYDFTYLSSDNNATVVGAGFVSLREYFESNIFKANWVANPGAGSAYGGLYLSNNPSSFFYGTLIK